MNTATVPITVQPPPFFRDHHVNGRPVFAAVEAMELLAADAARRFPEKESRRLSDLRFEKFLHLDTGEPVTAFNRVERIENGCLRSTLTTRFQSPKSKIARTLEHVSLIVGDPQPPGTALPMDMAACLAGICTVVEPQRIYAEMVPLGPAYRNIAEKLLISNDGAMARVGSPQPVDPRSELHLGSPYVLDAAFHAACVWCQRFCDCVAFPVSIDRRTVFCPTRLDRVYTARVVPRQRVREPFAFDIYIYDDAGRLCEAVTGIGMRDVSGGSNRPPQGFFKPENTDGLKSLRDRVSGLVLLERDALAPFAGSALTAGEKRRLGPMTTRRAGGYLSARLALKRLGRMLSGRDDRREANAMETVGEDHRSPRCPLSDSRRPLCSVAHDRRFTIAVAADRPVGVDVEPLSPKPLAAMHVYLHAEEVERIRQSPLDQAGAALRAWSAKEAAAKALGMDLAEAWERVRTIEMSVENSLLAIDGKGALLAVHATLENHLFTLITMDGPA